MMMTERGAHWPDLAGRLEGERHVLPIRVYYEDTDFSGLVYHASYLRFMERGRSDMIRLLGLHHRVLAAPESGEPAAFVVRHMEIDFLRPARMDDVLEIITEAQAMSAAVLTLRQEVMRGAEVLVRAAVKIVLIGASGKPLRLRSALPEAARVLLCGDGEGEDASR